MKSIHRIGLGAVLTAVSACVCLACDDTTPATPTGDDADTTTTGGDAGGAAEAATSGNDAGGGTDATMPSEGGATGDTGTGAEAGALSCASYCGSVMSACTGSNAQYVDMGQCMTTCALLPMGKAGDTSGNTVGCRATHATYAASGAVPHCWHAGPYGYGACGAECDAFCLLATTYCSAAGGFDAGAPPYASVSACTTACAGFAKVDDADGGGGVGVDGGYYAGGPTGGNTLDCREWHLDKALQGPGSSTGQGLHCGHVGATSSTCQ